MGAGRVAIEAEIYFKPEGFLPRNHTFRNRAASVRMGGLKFLLDHSRCPN